MCSIPIGPIASSGLPVYGPSSPHGGELHITPHPVDRPMHSDPLHNDFGFGQTYGEYSYNNKPLRKDYEPTDYNLDTSRKNLGASLW